MLPLAQPVLTPSAEGPVELLYPHGVADLILKDVFFHTNSKFLKALKDMLLSLNTVTPLSGIINELILVLSLGSFFWYSSLSKWHPIMCLSLLVNQSLVTAILILNYPLSLPFMAGPLSQIPDPIKTPLSFSSQVCSGFSFPGNHVQY